MDLHSDSSDSSTSQHYEDSDSCDCQLYNDSDCCDCQLSNDSDSCDCLLYSNNKNINDSPKKQPVKKQSGFLRQLSVLVRTGKKKN